jgi:hypothetical protein
MQLRLLTTVSALALFGALGTAQAASVASCPGQSNNPSVPSSWVLSDTIVSPGSVSYNFTVCNTSADFNERESRFLLRDWELPWDHTAPGAITNIRVPDGWGYTIEKIGVRNDATGWDGALPTWFDPSDPWYDPRYLGLDQEVLHFYTCGDERTCYGGEGPFGPALQPGESLAGFGFDSQFSATSAPYQASWVQEPPRSGDPDFPNARLVGPNTPGVRNPVPEPTGLALFALGLGAAMAARARRQGRKVD